MQRKLNLNSVFILALIALIALSANVHQTLAWTAIGFYHDDGYPGQCTISEDLIMLPGEIAKSPTQCAELKCLNDKGVIVVTGCGAVSSPHGCEWGDYVDIHAPFEQCCARYLVCEDGLNDENRQYQQYVWDVLGAPEFTTE